MATIVITEKQQATAAARATDEWNHVGGEWDDVVTFFTNPGVIEFRITATFGAGGDFREARAVRMVVASRGGGIRRVPEARATTTDWAVFIGWVSTNDWPSI